MEVWLKENVAPIGSPSRWQKVATYASSITLAATHLHTALLFFSLCPIFFAEPLKSKPSLNHLIKSPLLSIALPFSFFFVVLLNMRSLILEKCGL